MYISLIEESVSSLTHLHGFPLLVLLSWFIEIKFFVCTKRIILLNLNQVSGRLIIIAKGSLKLPNLHMLIKQKSHLRNLALGTYGELPIIYLTKVNLLYLVCSMVQSCCLLHLIKQNCLLKTLVRNLILMTQVSLYFFFLLELI